MRLKNVQVLLFFLLLFQQAIIAQNSNIKYLKKPLDWRFERMELPLSFAPNIKYKGFEEIRFAPGMFDRNASDYFSYVFIVEINNKSKITDQELKNFLLDYYKGLSYEVGKSNNLIIDSNKIKVDIKPSNTQKKKQSYNASIVFFDSFNNGEEVVLNLEITCSKRKASNDFLILALVSPSSKGANIWEKLHLIKEEINLSSH